MSLKRYRIETNCQNCGTEVKDKFCPNCGQENIQIHENFFQLVVEYVSDSFSFDSKILRSLVPLVTKPGFLTKEYWEGKRIRYIHPLKIFFYVTVVFALATAYFYEHYGSNIKNSMVFETGSLAKIDSTYLATLGPTDKIYVPGIPGLQDTLTVAEIKELKASNARRLRKVQSGVDFVFVNFKYVTFFLLPVYAFIVRLFYLKQKKFYVDHIIYTIHVQTFVYCLFSVLIGFMYFYPFALDILRQIAFGLITIYLALSLHYLYGQPWWKTLLKSLLIAFAFFITTGLAVGVFAVFNAIVIEK